MFIAGGGATAAVAFVTSGHYSIWNTLTSAYSVSTDSVLRLSVLKEVLVLEHSTGSRAWMPTQNRRHTI